VDDDDLIAVAGGDDAALRKLFFRHAPWLTDDDLLSPSGKSRQLSFSSNVHACPAREMCRPSPR
jgi:hypothetical protein